MAAFNGLKPGDIIDLVAPASQCDMKLLYQGIDVIKAWGYTPRLPKSLFNTHPYLSNDNPQRYEFLKAALMAPDSKAVWAIRGGYGCSKLIDDLRKVKPKQNKLFLGYSDNTWLHHFMYEQWGWQGLHSPLVAELGTGKLTPKSLLQLKKYLEEPGDISYTGLKPLNSAGLKRGQIRGRIAGGNLTVLQTTLGTSYSFYGKNKILFFEDVGERGYSVDRLLSHMLQSRVFKGARAIIFGDFVGGEEADGRNHINRALKEFAQEVKCPVFIGLKVGHGQYHHSVPMYRPSVLKTGDKPHLTVFNK